MARQHRFMNLGRWLGVVACASSLTLSAAPAWAQGGNEEPTGSGDTQTGTLLAGTEDVWSSGPWARLLMDLTDKPMACSGTVIGDHWVLTAQHCFWDVKPEILASNPAVSVTTPSVTPTGNNVDSVYLYPSADLALVKTKVSLPETPAEIASNTVFDLNSTKFRLCGRNKVDPKARNYLGNDRFWCGQTNGKNYYVADQRYTDETGQNLLPYLGGGTWADAIIGQSHTDQAYQVGYSVVGGDYITLPGDSGGGVFVDGKLVGVNSSSTQEGEYVGHAARISKGALAWIRKTAGIGPQWTGPDFDPETPAEALQGIRSGKVDLPVKTVSNTHRIGGPDRTITSLMALQGTKDRSRAVLATGLNFPDGLAAGALAGGLDTGVALTASKDTLEPDILNAFLDFGVKQVYIVGGEKVVTPQMEAQLNQAGITTERLAGQTRYETAQRVAEKYLALGLKEKLLLTDGSKYALVATAQNFPDALGASATAKDLGAPLILADEGATDSLQLAAGRKVICAGVQACKLVKQQGITPAFEAAGVDRYDTSKKLLQIKGDISPLRYMTLYVASGKNFPDALAGASQRADLLVAAPDVPTLDIPYQTTQVVYLGGPAVMPDKQGFRAFV